MKKSKKMKIVSYFLFIFLLVGCHKQIDTNKKIPEQSTTFATTTKQSSNFTEKNPYGLKAPNNTYNHLIVTDATGHEYLENNGYYVVSKSNTENIAQTFVSEIATILPNANNAYGTQIYMYFWCSDEMKSVLADVRINGAVVFFEATDEYLDQLKEMLSLSNLDRQDLDIEAINNGDISTLVGTWKNGAGEILVINADGTTNSDQTVRTLKDSDKISKIPYAGLSNGQIGSSTPIGLFKIGFKNPEGDYSDTTKPRLILAQQAWAYSAESYYYRQ